MAKTKEINALAFGDFVKDNKVALVDFWAPWCAPCRIIGPRIDELSEKYNGKVAFGKVNIDNEREMAASLGIMSIPTLLIFRDGNLTNKVVGAVPKEAIEEKLNALV